MRFISVLSILFLATVSSVYGFGGSEFTVAPAPGSYGEDCSNNVCDVTKNLQCATRVNSCKCKAGSYYNNILSQDSCVACPPGFFCQFDEGGFFNVTPLPCPSGEVSYAGSTNCVAVNKAGTCPPPCTPYVAPNATRIS
jgi:hypothetical protein